MANRVHYKFYYIRQDKKIPTLKALNKCQNGEGNYKIFETAKFTTDLSIGKQIKDIRIHLNKI